MPPPPTSLRASLPLLALLLLGWATTAVIVQGSDRQVNNDQQLYDAFVDQTVGSIGLAYNDASLAPYATALTNYRSLNIYGALPGANPTFDFAYIGGAVSLAAGTTFKLQGLSLFRMQALRAPVGLFTTSPGATVVVQDCINNQQVCWPSEAAQVYFTQVFTRPADFPGAQTATICPPNSETTCNQYTFNGGYNMHYVNTVINCQTFPDPLPVCPTLAADVGTPSAYNCLAMSLYVPTTVLLQQQRVTKAIKLEAVGDAVNMITEAGCVVFVEGEGVVVHGLGLRGRWAARGLQY
ncbi:hypothetical protein VOLCADRAFT_91963 [Volvox carteri f. nagariensis]|uniref:Pherophorin domain-containing protein n=1 Tax=Volvox carteri f. nagariensis TaxID=3068 RepID=D8TYE8_VOLCA|nr:uncharacterized protein VOLCADRAFT_91963 [Volvox carteri f. nagariensis]EFJ47543.1 hypothetical protein VOLCADRAFT_91963 [Volvox carteri f. nagariensis]|eukprot:XP_002951367.1 hypothetical protein VOLCADRAFT_91963 [Volvox carteri f. nagariensis]